MVKKKIGNFSSGTVLSLTAFFHVPKGDSNIRSLYHLTACGLNEAMWDTKLWMLSVEKIVDTATQYSLFGDVDAAEVFHN